MKKKIFIDFDGVLNTYNGWKGSDELFEPMPNTKEFLINLSKNYDNLSLSRIQKLPTILSSQHTKLDQLHMNLLLWKLLSLTENSLPPLFLLDVPSIEPTLMNWLCLRYSKMSGLLVVCSHT